MIKNKPQTFINGNSNDDSEVHSDSTGKRPVVVDACVLLSVTKRNILFLLSMHDCITLIWSKDILDEVKRNSHPLIANDIVTQFPDACIGEYDNNPELDFTFSQKDKHVVGAAIHTFASEIVSEDKHFLKDTPKKNLASIGIRALSADELFSDVLMKESGKSVPAFSEYRMNITYPRPYDVDEFIGRIERNGLVKTASVLGEHKFSL